MGRPTLPEDERRKEFRARMNKAERALLERLAARWGCSLNSALNRAVAQAGDGD